MNNTPSLLGCPFCAGGETHIHVNKGTWNGRGYGEPISVEVRHWCDSEQGQPSRMISRAGRDEASAIAAWNRRTPQPVVREPLTDGQAKEVLWNEHLRWMNAAGLDTEGMRPTGEWLDHWLFYVRAIERAHSITQKGGSNADT